MKSISLGKREVIIEPPKQSKGKSHTSVVTYFIFISGGNEYITFINAVLKKKPMGKKLEMTEQVRKVL